MVHVLRELKVNAESGWSKGVYNPPKAPEGGESEVNKTVSSGEPVKPFENIFVLGLVVGIAVIQPGLF